MSKVFINIWLVVLIIIAVMIRIQGVGDYHYNEDEAMHLGIAQGNSLREVLQFSLYEAHPPLGHIIRHYWQEFSDAIWFERSLSLLFGLLLIPLYYRIGKLLNGDLTGICCAALITFSYACIVHSYLIRNYIIFMFLISLCLYYYLRWSNTHKNLDLLGYFLFACLACLTHFSAIFSVFSIAAYEAIRMFWRRENLKNQFRWMLANMLTAVIAVTVYYIWVTYGIVVTGPYFSTSSIGKFILLILSNPINAIGYVLPGLEMIPGIIFLLFLPAIRNDRNLRQFIPFSFIPLLLGMFLLAIQYYLPAGTRHGVWVLPFIIPVTGWIIANGVTGVSGILSRKFSMPWMETMTIIILLSGWIVYGPEKRLGDIEYAVKQTEWRKIQVYLTHLDDASVIVASRDDSAMLGNIYTYLNRDIFSKKTAAILMPYHNTHILFDPYSRHIDTKEALMNTLKEAEKRNMLARVTQIIFMKTLWDGLPESTNPVPYLFTCTLLNKEIMSFPPFFFPQLQAGQNTSDDERKLLPVAFMTISKKDFFEKVLPPTGSAHSCLEEKSVP